MASRPIDLLLRIKADSSGVAPGLAGLTKGLDSAEAAAKDTSTALGRIDDKRVTPTVDTRSLAAAEAAAKDTTKALDRLDATSVDLTVNQQAIAAARTRIRELQDQMAHALALDVNADTRPAQREITRLKSSIRTLEAAEAKVTVTADTGAATAAVTGLRARLDGLATSLGGVAGQAEEALSGGSGGLLGLAKLGAGKAGIAGLAATAATAEVSLGRMAADIETTKLQFQGLTRSAEAANQVFGELKAFADTTPFQMPELTEATRTLLAYGVSADDAVSTLRDLAEAAAATGAPLDSITRAYGQMLGKGKVTNEELLQLQDAGVNAYGILADQLGVTVEAVEELASAGKLGRAEVLALRDGIKDMYGGSIAAQAASFNGQLSTFEDTVRSIGASLGAVFLPAMKDLLSIANAIVGPIAKGAGALAEFASQSEMTGTILSSSILGPLAPIAAGIRGIGMSSEESAGGIEDMQEAAGAGGLLKLDEDLKKVQTELSAQTSKLTEAQSALDRYFGTLGQGGAAQDRFTQSLYALGESVLANGRAMDGNSEKALANRDAMRQMASAAGEVLSQLQSTGAGADQLAGKTAELRNQFITTATQMGYTEAQAAALADQYGLVPGNVRTTVTQTGIEGLMSKIHELERRLADLDGKTATIGVRINYDGKLAELERQADRLNGMSVGMSVRTAPAPAMAAPAAMGGFAEPMAMMAASAPLPASEPAWPVPAPRALAGAGTRNYSISVNVEAGASPAEVGRVIVDRIRAFERAAGRGWRGTP